MQGARDAGVLGCFRGVGIGAAFRESMFDLAIRRAAGRGLLLNHWPLHGGFPGCARLSAPCPTFGFFQFGTRRGVAATPRAICMAGLGGPGGKSPARVRPAVGGPGMPRPAPGTSPRQGRPGSSYGRPLSQVYSLPEEAEEVLAGEDDEGEEEVPRRVALPQALKRLCCLVSSRSLA